MARVVIAGMYGSLPSALALRCSRLMQVLQLGLVWWVGSPQAAHTFLRGVGMPRGSPALHQRACLLPQAAQLGLRSSASLTHAPQSFLTAMGFYRLLSAMRLTVAASTDRASAAFTLASSALLASLRALTVVVMRCAWVRHSATSWRVVRCSSWWRSRAWAMRFFNAGEDGGHGYFFLPS